MSTYTDENIGITADASGDAAPKSRTLWQQRSMPTATLPLATLYGMVDINDPAARRPESKERAVTSPLDLASVLPDHDGAGPAAKRKLEEALSEEPPDQGPAVAFCYRPGDMGAASAFNCSTRRVRRKQTPCRSASAPPDAQSSCTAVSPAAPPPVALPAAPVLEPMQEDHAAAPEDDIPELATAEPVAVSSPVAAAIEFLKWAPLHSQEWYIDNADEVERAFAVTRAAERARAQAALAAYDEWMTGDGSDGPHLWGDGPAEVAGARGYAQACDRYLDKSPSGSYQLAVGDGYVSRPLATNDDPEVGGFVYGASAPSDAAVRMGDGFLFTANETGDDIEEFVDSAWAR